MAVQGQGQWFLERGRVEGLLPAGGWGSCGSRAAWQTEGTEDTRLNSQSVTVTLPDLASPVDMKTVELCDTLAYSVFNQ